MPAHRLSAQDTSTGWVRPYARTGGRTTPSRALPVEALICTASTGAGLGRGHPAEYRRICDLCCTPRSVAEVSACLQLPLQATRVLLGDLADRGLIRIHSSDLTRDGRPTEDLLHRVLHGLRRL